MTEICELLKETRMRCGLSLEDVAEKTYIKLPYLEALEAGTFDKLPAPVYTYGYIRQYAKVLGLDGGELVARLQNRPYERTANPPELTERQEPVLPPPPRRDAVRYQARAARPMAAEPSSEAEREAQDLIRGAERYVGEVLGQLEAEVNRALQIVRNGRELLRSRRTSVSGPHSAPHEERS